MTALIIFIALWFDPRISYIQRDVTDNREHILAVDNNGTRKSQNEFGELNQKMIDNTRRIQALEDQYKKIDEALTVILQKLAERK